MLKRICVRFSCGGNFSQFLSILGLTVSRLDIDTYSRLVAAHRRSIDDRVRDDAALILARDSAMPTARGRQQPT